MSQEVDRLIKKLRRWVGVSAYLLRAPEHNAPFVVDCSSLMQWGYKQIGVMLPRRAYQQLHACEEVWVGLPTEALPGDLIFCGGSPRSNYERCPLLSVGHVGLLTADMTVIHAANKGCGVVEQSVYEFLGHPKYRFFWAGRVLGLQMTGCR